MRIIVLLLSFALLATGCSILPKLENRSIHYFDIAVPAKKISLKVPVELSSVESVFSEMTQMSFRDVGNSVRIDEYNRWSDLPSSLLRKRFLLAFNTADIDKSNALAKAEKLDVEILRFDLDLQKKTANISALFVVHDADGRNIVLRAMIAAEEKVRVNTAAGYAEAMGVAVSDLTNRLVAKLNAKSASVPESKPSVQNDKK